MVRKILITLIAILSLCGCASQTQSATEPSEASGEYSICIHSQGGMPLSGISVYVYRDTELVSFGETDAEGVLSLTMPQSEDYTVILDSVPKGYRTEEVYTFHDRKAQITLTSSLRTDESLSSVTLGLGDVMYDFEIVTTDGSTLSLSQMLAEKEMVLLNFFFTTCGPCASEFPYLQQAYETYQDKVGVIALDPLDDVNTVSVYRDSMGLTIPMAACNPSWSQTFGLTGYPTSVVIDRYGVICLIEVGGITSLQPFVTLFEQFTGDDYQQKLYGSLSEMITVVKPTYTMASSQEISEILGTTGLDIAYRPEEDPDSAEYSWPFIRAEKNGQVCLKASNQSIDGSYAILYADITLEEGQAVALDYLSSTEKGCDILYIIVDGQDVFAISGYDEEESWKTCYPWVALQSGTHEIALCYLKDTDTCTGDDTVYLRNLRVVDVSQIDEATYIPRLAATEQADGWSYADIVLSQEDGYYHVGTADGPLLLADLMNYTQFAEEQTMWDLVYNSRTEIDGQLYYDAMVDHFSYASNSAIYGVAPVNQDLRHYLELADSEFGFDTEDTLEWMRCCTYYAAYGTDRQLQNPCAGLSKFAAYTAVEGVGVPENFFYYDRPIMPRGLLARFTPTRSGVYLITSHTDSEHGVNAWIFGEDRETDMYTYAADQRLQADPLNCYMYYYMEAGRDYYIDIAFWDIYEIGTITYDIEYVGSSHDVFRLASPGFFTYDTDATGSEMYSLISGGIDVTLGEDGIYYHLLPDGTRGSKLYCDFTGITGVFSDALATVPAYDEDGNPLTDGNGDPVMRKGLIDKGAFDFSRTENDQYIQGFLNTFGGDVEKTDEYLRSYWAEDYDANAELYQIEDVYAGYYHGNGEDLTVQMEAFLDDIITGGPAELQGCVPVTEELAQLLQLLMDKFTFRNVDHSWTKLCYYYDHLGPK